MKKLAGRLSYANVVATLALFVALGGASYAAIKLPKNSVGTKQLKANAVTAAKIKKGAVTGSKIDLASLGTVPSATSALTASNAQALGGQTAAQITDSAKLKCPAGTKLGGGVCFEEALRTKRFLLLANLACAEAGRRLPDMGEVLAYDMQYYTSAAPPPYVWVNPDYFAEGTFRGMKALAYSGSPPNLQISGDGEFGEEQFRCVIPPTS
jgi:hypothetical protein